MIRESLPNVRELEATGLVLMGWLIRIIPLVPETWIAVNPVRYNVISYRAFHIISLIRMPFLLYGEPSLVIFLLLAGQHAVYCYLSGYHSNRDNITTAYYRVNIS